MVIVCIFGVQRVCCLCGTGGENWMGEFQCEIKMKLILLSFMSNFMLKF